MADPVSVDPAFWVLFATQLPALVGAFIAQQRGLLYVGRTVNDERAAMQLRLEAEIRRADLAMAERKEAEERLDAFRETMKKNLDVLERSVDLNSKLAAERTTERNQRRAEGR